VLPNARDAAAAARLLVSHEFRRCMLNNIDDFEGMREIIDHAFKKQGFEYDLEKRHAYGEGCAYSSSHVSRISRLGEVPT